ncbi:hypothetical protein BDR26DRAFT_855365 [Obelidium mucronatum]|nr:hypothetical protein BDR26DRAFT_855365 [Obelidium mucronatum]
MAVAALATLGYKLKTGKPYEFVVKRSDQAYNQRHYEDVGAVMTDLICERLVIDCGLIAQTVPLDAVEGEPTSTVFMSPGIWDSNKPLLLLVPGMSIQVGQWARKIVINESVYKGSMLEYVDRAQKKEGYNVLILNNNLNRINNVLIRGSESPEKHVQYVWKNIVSKTPAATSVFVVAHSFGGVCMQKLVETLEHERDEHLGRLRAIALTDSVHGYGGFFASSSKGKSEKKPLFSQLSVNFVQSDFELGKAVGVDSCGVELVSAGTEQHDQTTVVAIDFVFAFLKTPV